MSLQTSLKGRLKNTSLSNNNALMPVFEAVVNSIHALEDRGNLTTGEITLEIHRNTQRTLNIDNEEKAEITGFTVTDNGIGFNDANMNSFQTLDSDYKEHKGCKGIGRLLWLKAFKRVTINSTFKNPEGNISQRQFTFDSKHDLQEQPPIPASTQTIQTKVMLQDFMKKYQLYAPKTAETIANKLLEHCLWYFYINHAELAIFVRDSSEKIDLRTLYRERIHSSAKQEQIQIKGQTFNLSHIKFRASSQKDHLLSLCAASRLVKDEKINDKIPGLHGKLADDSGEFTYTCYVQSDFLDQKVRAERNSFEIEETVQGLFVDSEISMKDIREEVYARAGEHLSQTLQANITAGRERIEKYTAEKAPRYRSLLNRLNSEEFAVNPSISDKELELHLHKHWTRFESELLEQGHNVMQLKPNEGWEDYQQRLEDYLGKISDIKQYDLANYVSHRRLILEMLREAINQQNDGKYVREELIHNLIMPMRKDSKQIPTDTSNLWLVDERLAFHNYLASDKKLDVMPIVNTDSEYADIRPDILALNVYDNPLLVTDNKKQLPMASITVIEIKRPMRNDAVSGEEKDPIIQVLKYLNSIREGKAQTASGRPIPESKSIPGFCYIISDLTESVKQCCELADLISTNDKTGYFGYKKNYDAYIEVISYDRLINAATERNRAFFDKLGLPVS